MTAAIQLEWVLLTFWQNRNRLNATAQEYHQEDKKRKKKKTMGDASTETKGTLASNILYLLSTLF